MAPNTTVENERARKRVESLVTSYNKIMPATNFDLPFTKLIEVLSTTMETTPNSIAKATFVCTIPNEYINNLGPGREIHGGAVAMMLDNTTSSALLASNRYFGQGVTKNINVTYFKPPRAGDRIIIEAEVLQIGKLSATIQGVMKRASDAVVLAICLHEKLNADRGGAREFSHL